ncbi:MAG: hypothetical protein AB8H86_32750 [Polyangiales bacterium]
MGMTPAFMLVARVEEVHSAFAALAASADSQKRSALALYLPWSPARTIEGKSGSIGIGIRGWHGWARDVENSYSFSLSLRETVPCDLSVFVGQTYALFELRASTREGARQFSDESFRKKSRFVSAFESCVLGIWYDNEHDPWRAVFPRDRQTKIHCFRDDIEEHWTSIPELSTEVVDIDKLGDLLVWLVSADE